MGVTMEAPNKVYLTPSPAFLNLSPASRQTIKDAIKFSSEIGFEPIFIKNRRENIALLNPTFYGKLLQAKSANVILATYPYICRPTKDHLFRYIESRLLKKLLLRDKFSILYIIDLPIEQSIASGREENVDEKAYRIEKSIFESFDILLVFNENMKKIIQKKYDITNEKFIKFEILDYGADYTSSKEKRFSKPIKIVYSGGLDKTNSKWVKQLPYVEDIICEFSGSTGEWINDLQKKNIQYVGLIPKNKFFNFLSEHHFGLIYKEFKTINYYELTSTSKFSAYMVAGLPVLCPSKFSYISHLVGKYKVGLVFESFKDIPKLIDNLSEENYKNLINNCIKLGEKIKKGYFFKKAVRKAMEMLY